MIQDNILPINKKIDLTREIEIIKQCNKCKKHAKLLDDYIEKMSKGVIK